MFSPPHGGSNDGPEQEQVQRRERRLVLLVDDCQDTRELYAEYLELSGFDVKEAGDGIVASQYLHQFFGYSSIVT